MKRMILVSGGKGGTAKTCFCGVDFYWLVKSGVKVQGYDSDLENPTFFKQHKAGEYPVSTLDLLDPAEARDFLIQLKALEADRPDVLVIDMPRATGEQTRELIERFNFFKAAEILGYKITIVSVLNTEPEPIASLAAMMQFCGSKTDYVVVKPQVWAQNGKSYSLWQRWQGRTEFESLGGVEIELPILEPIVFQALREKSLPFFAIESLDFPDNLLAGSFLELGKLQLDLAAAYLGLPVADNSESKSKKESKLAGSK